MKPTQLVQSVHEANTGGEAYTENLPCGFLFMHENYGPRNFNCANVMHQKASESAPKYYTNKVKKKHFFVGSWRVQYSRIRIMNIKQHQTTYYGIFYLPKFSL